MQRIHKYPRTQHIEGSRFQPGDADLKAVPFAQIAGRSIVVEEKVDGANCGMSFTAEGELLLQSRGHYLSGGPREKHFTLLKQWASVHQAALRQRLSDRYVVYGEWLYAKHTVFYNALPHYLLEFDVLDTREHEFLDTPRRRELLDGLPLPPVKVLYSGLLQRVEQLASFMGPSHFIRGAHLDDLRRKSELQGLDAERVICETDRSNHMEGLYVKVEEGGAVVERYKFIRPDFLTAVLDAEGHWLNRPIVTNDLVEVIDLFGCTL
jgi:hypothetical protein